MKDFFHQNCFTLCVNNCTTFQCMKHVRFVHVPNFNVTVSLLVRIIVLRFALIKTKTIIKKKYNHCRFSERFPLVFGFCEMLRYELIARLHVNDIYSPRFLWKIREQYCT